MKSLHALFSRSALLRNLTVLGLALQVPTVHAEVDPSLAFALEGVWRIESPAVSLLSDEFDSKEQKDGVRHEARVKDTPAYITSGEEGATVEYSRKRFPATDTPWGSFPQIDLDKAQLLEMTLPKKRYLVIAGKGKGLFAINDWQRFGFLHVLDVSSRSAPVYYPLVAEAELGSRVLGRLPGSSVLNYARLVPSRWASNVEPSAYEVVLYALKPKGPEQVIENGKPLAYSLTRTGAGWKLDRIKQTPVTDARDQAHRPFTAPAVQAPAAKPAGNASPAPSQAGQ
ncbi:hypothetical protein [Pseudomonas sp. RIT-PI-AD]|uniref:hypothetical protein n=1 Tax=Pseudomonas sp. RIT-PI-AD TaxID=3035294 RepID=UPI0021D9C22C|nr:hypothetical protein [Pseudomonas sp. RIT-PI-AD]